jgi:hypothetical protein
MQVVANDGNLSVATLDHVMTEYDSFYQRYREHGLYVPHPLEG